MLLHVNDYSSSIANFISDDVCKLYHTHANAHLPQVVEKELNKKGVPF